MQPTLRDVYAHKALAQVPRLLSLEDRNPFSPTYGCCNREFWLCRSTDFPSAIAQFGLHALALAWRHEMPGNFYYQKDKIRHWVVAGMDYWTKIQKRDGSFDEFYPNERGWAGPTGFLLYAMINCYWLLGDAFPDPLRARFLESCERAALHLVRWDEPGVLANHHAMAVLPVFEAARLLNSRRLWDGYEARLAEFYSYCDPEGWCLEYDGADPGYLSATVSFLAKIYKHRAESPRVAADKRMLEVMTRAVDFCSYFVYPNRHYAGTIGSRQTLHFYPHGFEILAPRLPMAAAVADRMLEGLAAGALVPPAIQEDRYYQYRVPEFLLSYLDYGVRPTEKPLLPHEREPFEQYFPRGGFHISRTPRTYLVVNLAKGGVVKQFDVAARRLTFNDCGLLAELEDGRVVTSQWIDPAHRRTVAAGTLEIEGQAHLVPAKYFTPLKFIAFRLGILALGWHAGLAYRIKGCIRTLLMTRARGVQIRFHRVIERQNDVLLMSDTITVGEGVRVRRLMLGDEMPIRYVPQSRYFQPQELDVEAWFAPREAVERLNVNRRLRVRRRIALDAGRATIETEME
jgi:hypothetical protein